ncbi:AraC-like protein [Chitinophaga japonensis]|uniref:AraC-like protein n=2 Tax=Chitinophaga japonensis TaxID=104662 RepID=A0A562TD39_CHIJA|nr:AraC-like protein [Chitinophaga japonensis]
MDLLEDYVSGVKVPARGSIVVHRRGEHVCRTYVASSRRDYYKISLITAGTGIYTLGAQPHQVAPPTLIFTHPLEIKSWEGTSVEQDGYNCLFTERLFEKHRHYREDILRHPLFQPGAQAVLPLTSAQAAGLQSIFEQLMREYNNTAAFRQEAILLYLQLLLLEGRRAGRQTDEQQQPFSAGQWLVQRFTNLLEKQFPIENMDQQVPLRTAGEYALALNVHPNHLNATVKQLTGRTVSEHIRHRLLLEAKLLLLHTDWHIGEIARSLGFEEPANFTHFFKSQAGQSPHIFRTL